MALTKEIPHSRFAPLTPWSPCHYIRHRAGILSGICKAILLYQEFLAEREEILRHKWLESERLGYDIGFERALLDWIASTATAGVRIAARCCSTKPRAPFSGQSEAAFRRLLCRAAEK